MLSKGQEKVAARATFDILGYKVCLPRGGYAARRTSPKNASFAFIVLLDLGSSPTLLPSPLPHPVETGRPHHKRTIMKTITTTAIPIANRDISSFITISLWWSRGESNPRPECLHSEGITTILLFNCLLILMSRLLD